jgi:4-hydroxy-3-polyprenylbenzoate decarboxylase
MTGATGAVYGIRLLEALQPTPIETHLIMSLWAERTIVAETDWKAEHVAALADRTWGEHELSAPVVSGSFVADGMIIAPCSMRSLAAIATGTSDNMIHRAADVTLKEGRKLVLLVRESPLSVIHLENMLKAARAGAVIAPPLPAFYARPRDLEEMIDHTVGRILDQFRVDHQLVHRWGDKRDRG